MAEGNVHEGYYDINHVWREWVKNRKGVTLEGYVAGTNSGNGANDSWTYYTLADMALSADEKAKIKNPIDFNDASWGDNWQEIEHNWNREKTRTGNTGFEILDFGMEDTLKWFAPNTPPAEQIQALIQFRDTLKYALKSQEDMKAYQDALVGFEERKVTMAEDRSEVELKAAEDQILRSKTLWDTYVKEYQPKEISFIAESFRGEPIDEKAAQAGVAVQRAGEQQKAQTERQMTGLGIDPSSPRYQAAMQQNEAVMAAAKAGAMTTARDKARSENYAKKLTAVGLIKGQPTEAAQIAATGMQGASGGANLLGGAGGGIYQAGQLGSAAAGNVTGIGLAGAGSQADYLKLSDARNAADDVELPVAFNVGIGALAG